MPTPLTHAKAIFAADGTPWSEAYQDVYHSAEGGLAQSRHVFLGGNHLPARWAGRERFVVLETGFGFGLNFLATWQAWRADAERCSRLHFVSIEKHPFQLADLRLLHERCPELATEAAQLHACWPLLVPGAHRLEFDAGRVVLTLLFADVSAVRSLRLAADAIYLDGFAPAKNPDMWSGAVMRALARLAAPGATAATWSVAGTVVEALQRTGFAVEKCAGFGAKKEMLRAHYRGPLSPASPPPRARQAIVIGAGLAGGAVCERLCARGWNVTLVERREQAAQEASGNHASVFHPVLTADDSVFARMTRAGYLAALQQWPQLEARGERLRWDLCGVLQLARNEREEVSQRAAIAALAPPPEYAQLVTREEASAHAGVPVAGPGLWFPQSGWIQPAALVQAQLRACGARLERRFGVEAQSIAREGGEWRVYGANGILASAPYLVLANAADAVRLAPVAHLRLRRIRGQMSHLPAEAMEAPHVGVLRGGLVLPPVDGVCVVGATYDLEDDDATLRESGHAANLERLQNILPGAAPVADPRALTGRVGMRAVAPDRLPIAGTLPEEALYGVYGFGSRGLIWAPLAAELLASQLEAEPLPLEAGLVDALDPQRFAKRAARRSGRAA